MCSMSKIRWLCWPHRLALVGLFCAVPSFSGSEMIWLDPLLGCLGAAAHCEMNGIYTSMFFVEMNVVPTSRGQ